MERHVIYGVCRVPFEASNAYFVRVHALRFVNGRECNVTDFPDEEGDVFWPIGPELPEWVQEGALCTLETEHAPKYGESGFCWHQTVRNSVVPLPVELIDLSDQIASEDELLNFRTFYVYWPVPERVYVRLGDFVFGPFDVNQRRHHVSIVEGTDDQIYYRYQWADMQSEFAIPVRTHQGHTRWVLENETDLSRLRRRPRDGRTVRQLLNWYLRGLQQSADVPQSVQALITRKVFRRVAASHEAFSGGPELTEHRAHRLETLGSAFRRFTQKNPSILEFAMGRDAFGEAVRRRIDEIVEEKSTEIEQRLQPLQDEWQSMVKQRDELSDELSRLRARLAEESDAFAQEMEHRMEALQQQRQHLDDERARLLHDFFVFKALMNEPNIPPVAAALDAETATVHREGGPSDDESADRKISSDEFVEKPETLARQLLHAAGGDFNLCTTFEPIHTAVAKHRLFALQGQFALEWMQRYVAALGPASRFHPVVVETGWTNLEPLFGRVNARTRRFEPVATRAFDFWREAVENNPPEATGLQFLVFIDANRSPIEVWMAKLLLMAAQPDLFPLSLFHAQQIAPDDPVSQWSQLDWPSHLRIVCLLTDDDYSYPVAEALQQRLPVFSVEQSGPTPPPMPVDNNKSVSAGRVSQWDWTTIVEALK